MEKKYLSAEEALAKLKEGNQKYLTQVQGSGDISPQKRLDTARHGQVPYAIVLTCSDSRVIPEKIFATGIGELFVIRVAGNVIGFHEMGSIEYAVHHLKCPLLLVMGHTNCGAVGAALEDVNEGGFISGIIAEIRMAIQNEKDPHQACLKNIENSMNRIRSSLNMSEHDPNAVRIEGAVYDIETGKVDFL